jgi:hypothetical protein
MCTLSDVGLGKEESWFAVEGVRRQKGKEGIEHCRRYHHDFTARISKRCKKWTLCDSNTGFSPSKYHPEDSTLVLPWQRATVS